MSEFGVDPLCGSLFQKLKSSKVETKEFLRPVFKWMKQGGRNYNPERAFLFVEWMIMIRETGDPSSGIAPHSHIQPKYAYNTIITMSQRYDNHDLASRAFNCMLNHGMTPDVFTLTALVDVMGRNCRFDEAMDLYHDMLSGKMAHPNVVTFVSLIRVAGNLRDRNDVADIVQSLVEDAYRLSSEGGGTQVSDGAVVVSIYNAALSAFVRLQALDNFVSVLFRMRAEGVQWTGLTSEIVSKFFWRHGSSKGFTCAEQYASHLHAAGAIETTAVTSLIQDVEEYVQQKDKRNSSERKVYAGCLGPDAPPAMRLSVMQHDVGKLLDRLEPSDCSQLTENDFVTLLHQCRKRKWVDQIAYVLSQMVEVSAEGIPSSGVPPQVQLAPSRPTFEAAMDGYFHVMQAESARSLLLEAMNGDDIDLDDDFLFFSVGGFLHCGAAQHAVEAYFLLRDRDVLPSVHTVRCMLRGLGGSVDDAYRVLCDVFDLLQRGEVQEQGQGQGGPLAAAVVQGDLLRTLLQSSAALGRPECLLQSIGRCMESQRETLRSTAEAMTCGGDGPVDFELIQTCLMAACCTHQISFAMPFLARCQQLQYLPPSLFIYSLALEALGCFVDQTSSQAAVSDSMSTLPFRGFLRVGAVKLLEGKAPLLLRFFPPKDEASALGRDCLLVTSFSTCQQHGEGPWEVVVSYFTSSLCDLPADALLNHYARCQQVSRSPVLALSYLQHLFALSVMVRCKGHKELLLQKTLTSLLHCTSHKQMADFVCDLFEALPKLEISNKQQAKLIGLVLSSIVVKEQSGEWTPSTGDNVWTLVSAGMLEACPCLEVVKEVCRSAKAVSPDWSAYLTDLLVMYLEQRRETPVKVVQMIKQFGLHQVLDLSALEELLVVHCLEDVATHWMALSTYISDHGTSQYYDACARVCRILSDLNELELAARLLCRFQVVDEEEFAHILHPSAGLFCASSDDLKNSSLPTRDPLLFPVLRIDELSVPVLVVDGEDSLRRASLELQSLFSDGRNHPHPVVALDAEWRPFSRGGGRRSKCSLLQVACCCGVFLFDLMVLEESWTQGREGEDASELHSLFGNLIGSLLASRSICKIGVCCVE